MANTRDTLGDQATLDGLVSHTLETFEDDGVTSLRLLAFYKNSGLKRVKLPNLVTIPHSAFYESGLTKIEEADLPNVETIGPNAFYKCYELTEVTFPKAYVLQGSTFACPKLTKAVFRSSSKITFGSSGEFSLGYKLRHLVLDSPKKSNYVSLAPNSPFTRGEGAVYIPTDMVATYKADANWGKLIIEDIANYPLEKFETITDSWAEIVANQNYATDYAIGDTKAIQIGSLWYTAEIVGIDKDVDANGDTIPLTWMLIDLLADTYRMNATGTNANGWAEMALRTTLASDILPTIDIKNLIIPAKKTYFDDTSKSTKECVDSLWIPSARELLGGNDFEDNGCIYDERFGASNKRIKYVRESSSDTYWTRTANGSAFRTIATNGTSSSLNPYSMLHLALGFCTM